MSGPNGGRWPTGVVGEGGATGSERENVARDRGGVYGPARVPGAAWYGCAVGIGRSRHRRSPAIPPRTPVILARARGPTEESPISNLSRPAVVLAVAMLGAACQPAATSTPARPGTTTSPSAPGSGATTPSEANVITGRVSTEAGQPIPGAQLRIVGYTGGANLGRAIETVASDMDGRYRYVATSGLYEVLGTAAIQFDGQTFVFDLEPTDQNCDQQLSDDGIVEDFVLRLTGISPCNVAADPENYLEYHGAAIQLFDQMTGSYGQDAVVRYTLEPTSPLADGSVGEALTFTRTVTALHTSAGPIESTWIIHDVPLARYRVTASLLNGAGGEVPLLLATGTAAEPAASVELAFEARLVVGTPDVGYRIPNLTVYDSAGAG